MISPLFDDTSIPEGAILNKVDVTPQFHAGRRCLRVELDKQTRSGELGVDFGDFPTFLVLPVEFRNGTIEVDVLARLSATAPNFARGFIGVAYRIRDNCQSFECVYVRPLNGLKLAPPAPRDRRAVQYFAYPDWKYDRLRDEFPDGPYEAAADIADEEWITLRLEITGQTLTATVNGQIALSGDFGLSDPVTGNIGLWVDIGTEGYFSNLRVTPRDA